MKCLNCGKETKGLVCNKKCEREFRKYMKEELNKQEVKNGDNKRNC